jgi:hypothetical protein
MDNKPLAPRLRLLRRDARVGPAALKVKDAWISHDIDARWRAAFRLVRSRGHVRVGEVRVFPIESGYRNNGEWSAHYRGLDAEAPRRGITKQLLRRVQPHLWLALGSTALGGQQSSHAREFAMVFGPPPPDPPKGTTRRGRPSHDDLFLARVARDYERALRKAGGPVKALADKHDALVTRVRGWVHKARLRGFLTPSTQGKPMGRLTPKGRFVLETRTKGGTDAAR